MARIENQTAYPLDGAVTKDDYIIGTDADEANRTKNYKVEDILALGGVAALGIIKEFRVDFATFSFGGTLEVYADGALVTTLTAHDQSVNLDLSKTLLFVPINVSPTAYITYEVGPQVAVYQSASGGFFPSPVFVKLNETDYNNLEGVIANDYAVITVFDVV